MELGNLCAKKGPWMATANNLIEHASELSELAAQCGIDWYQVHDVSPGTYHNLPTTHKKYKGTCTMWVREYEDRAGDRQISITFHTRKHHGITSHWHSKSPGGFKGTQLPNRTINSEEEERKRRRERFEAYKKGWGEASKAEKFEYLDRKGIAGIIGLFDLRVTTDRKVFGRGSVKSFLCFPLQDRNGNFVGLQRIYEDGTKKLTSSAFDGHYVGAHSILGDPEAGDTIYIAEGFATAASVHLATNLATVFAYSAQNLDPVAAHFRSRFPDKKIVIAADNDWTPKGNGGVYKALEAAFANRKNGKGLSIIIPPLIDGKKTDFNDIHVQQGLERLKAVIDEPSNSMRPGRDRAQFLMELLPHATPDQLPKLIRKIAVMLKVPFFVPAEKLQEHLTQILGDRADQGMIVKAIRAVIVAGTYKAKKIASINRSSVDRLMRFQTVQSDAGHLVISPDSAERIMQELAEGRTVIVRAPMGTGKTEIIIRSAMAAASRAAHILPRVSVVDDAAGRLNLDHYRDIDQFRAYFTYQMVSCVNSMGAPRFIAKNGRGWFDNLDLLCLDEASQVLPQVVLLGNHARRKGNHSALANCIRTARAVLVADADANEFLVNELKRIDPERKITLVEIEHSPHEQKRWQVKVTDSTTVVRDGLLEAIGAGERCLLATDNKQNALVLERLIREHRPQARILNVHREPSKDRVEMIKRFYDSPNTECRQYDLLIYSPAITSGVSITTPHFTRHFGIFTGIIKVNDIMQMMGRDRTAKEWLLALAPRGWAEERLRAAMKLEAVGDSPTLFSELKQASDHYEIEARENLAMLAMNILKQKGHRVSMIETKRKKCKSAIDSMMAEIALNLKTEREHRILSQPDIAGAAYFNLKRSWMPDTDQAAAIDAYEIRHILCADLTAASISFKDQGGFRKIALFELLRTPDADIECFDKNEQKTIDPSLQYRAGAKKRMLLETMQRLGVDQVFAGEFTHEKCRGVVDYFLEHGDEANVIFSGIIDRQRPPRCATTFVQKLFKRLGLRLGARKSNGHMIRFVDPSDVELMTALSERRRERGQSFIRPAADQLAA